MADSGVTNPRLVVRQTLGFGSDPSLNLVKGDNFAQAAIIKSQAEAIADIQRKLPELNATGRSFIRNMLDSNDTIAKHADTGTALRSAEVNVSTWDHISAFVLKHPLLALAGGVVAVIFIIALVRNKGNVVEALNDVPEDLGDAIGDTVATMTPIMADMIRTMTGSFMEAIGLGEIGMYIGIAVGVIIFAIVMYYGFREGGWFWGKGGGGGGGTNVSISAAPPPTAPDPVMSQPTMS